ncbi:MAG: zinc ABC transporter substrate-binding protein ZnuA [Pseudomonadota bacterium]
MTRAMKAPLAATLLMSTFLSTTGFAYAAPDVVVSIKPVHSLVASVMQGVGEPVLLLDGATSPHDYALKPSQASELQSADLIFWIGEDLETFLEKPLETIGSNAKAVSMMDAEGLFTLPFREGGAFEAHDHAHDDHDHSKNAHDDHKHDDHAHDEDKHDDHAHEEGKHDDHAHDDHAHEQKAEHDHNDHAEKAHDDHGHDHAKGAMDPHIWLDPQNAKVIAKAASDALSEVDPENAATYAANLSDLNARLDALGAEIDETLAPAKGKAFVVFHDAYHYFEHRFDFEAAGSITVNPEVQPGAERVREIRDRIKELGAVCVFSEPQFTPAIVETVTEGSNANGGVLDPLGAAIENGPDLYPALVRNMANSLASCLSGES